MATKRITTVDEATDEIERVVYWMSHIAEHEYTDGERKRLIAAAKDFRKVAKPIVSKYVD